MRVGYSSECINPESVSDIELSGYGWYLNRKAHGVLRDIFVRSLYITDGDKAFLIINCDLLALSEGFVEDAKSGLAELLNINKKSILFLCVHTHTAPAVSETIGCGAVNHEYVRRLYDKVILSAVLAAKNQYEVESIEYGSRKIDPICANRVSPGGYYDSNVYAVRFNLAGQKPYILVQYGCHPVAHGVLGEISPDYPGFVLAGLEKLGYNGMFLTGCCADVDPLCRTERGSGTSAELSAYGAGIADGALEALDMKSENPEIDFFDFSFCLTEDRSITYNTEAVWRECFMNKADAGERKAARQWLDAIGAGDIVSKENVYVQVLSIGDMIIIGAPGELTAEIGKRIRGLLSGKLVLVCENANGAFRYVGSDESIAAKDYEGFSSNIVYKAYPLKPGSADIYITEVIKNIESR